MTSPTNGVLAAFTSGLILTTIFNFTLSPLRGQTTKELIKRYETEKHIGTIDEALVGITVEYHDAAGKLIDVRHGNGVVVRCDVFILAPEGLYRNRPGIKIDAQSSTYLHLYPGTAKEVKISVKPPFEYNLDGNVYLLRSKTIHVPAVRCLLPEGIKKGEDLESVSSDWDAVSKRFLKPSHHAVHRGDPSLDSAKLWTSKLEETLENVMAGSVIVTSEGMLFGMTSGYDGTYRRSEFFNMSLLDRVTSSVAAIPTTEASFLADHPKIKPVTKDENFALSGAIKTLIFEDPEGSSDGMASVPGGPVIVPSNIVTFKKELSNASIVCTAPFQIDKYEVTNEDYYKFWKELKPAQQQEFYPATWKQAGAPFGTDLAKSPVIGVSYKGALAYAKKQGKSLPTACEYILSALGKNGETDAPAWMKKYVGEVNATAENIAQEHEKFLRSNTWADYSAFNQVTFLPNSDTYEHSNVLVTFAHLGVFWPWLPKDRFIQSKREADDQNDDPAVSEKILSMIEFSTSTIAEASENMDVKWKNPYSLSPVGARDYDVSPFGAFDMLLNSHEYILTKQSVDSVAESIVLDFQYGKLEKLGYPGQSWSNSFDLFPASPTTVISYPFQYEPSVWLRGMLNMANTVRKVTPIRSWTLRIATIPSPVISGLAYLNPITRLAQRCCNKWANLVKYVPEIPNAFQFPNTPLVTDDIPAEFLKVDQSVRFGVAVKIGFRCAR